MASDWIRMHPSVDRRRSREVGPVPPEGDGSRQHLHSMHPKQPRFDCVRATLLASALLLGAPLLQAETVYGLGTGNFLFRFDSLTPGTVTTPVAVSGLGGSTLLGIDVRPADGLVYGIGTGDRVFSIQPSTGVATDVTSASFLTSLGAGTQFGIDFNPVVNRLRIVSDADTNLRIFGTGLSTDSSLAFQAGDANFGIDPTVTAVAYTNPDNNPGTGTTLFGIDTSLNVLVQHNTAPGFQNLQTIGALGVDIADVSGFDISISGTAYGAFQNGTASELYTIDLLTGSATRIGTIGGDVQIRDLAVAVPEPETYAAMAGASLVAFAVWRRRGVKSA